MRKDELMAGPNAAKTGRDCFIGDGEDPQCRTLMWKLKKSKG